MKEPAFSRFLRSPVLLVVFVVGLCWALSLVWRAPHDGQNWRLTGLAACAVVAWWSNRRTVLRVLRELRERAPAAPTATL